MSIKRSIIGLIRNYEKTDESSKDKCLKTPYYNKPIKDVLDKLLNTINSLPSWEIVHIDEDRGEILVEISKPFWKEDMVITVVAISFNRTAVDVISSKRGIGGDLGSNYQNILKLFKQLDLEIPSNQ
ncbi:DUF1499 domain-containing protein [Bacillus sp. Marseille-P3661]|uniref:DUF1499 domain-containing protein n=1 Tax=Bacillus sp. Marseille-P3661 TaxID=1936234 RepID=UPI000C81B00B|nr:DUF1499 domain-containing protein [Bacillus sp. Marseille-P3661]